MSIKCGSCGLVNWDTACVCRRCSAPVNAPRPIVHTQSLPQSQAPQTMIPQAPPTAFVPPHINAAAPPQTMSPRPTGLPAPPPHPQAAIDANQRPLHQQLRFFDAGQHQQTPPVQGRQTVAPPQGLQAPPNHAPPSVAPNQLPYPQPPAAPPNHWPAQAPGQHLYPPAPNAHQPAPTPHAPYPQPTNNTPYANPQAAQYHLPYRQPSSPPNGAPYANPQGNPQQRVYPNPQGFAHPQPGQYVAPTAPGQLVNNITPNPYAPPVYTGSYAPPYQGYYPNAPQGGAGYPVAPNRYVPPPQFATSSSLGAKLKILVAVLVIGAGIFLFAIRGLLNRQRLETIGEQALKVKYLKVPNQDPNSLEGMRENLLVYLGKDRDPRFGYEEIRKQLFIGVDEIAYDQDKGEVLFLLSNCSDSGANGLQRAVSDFASDPARATYGEAARKKEAAFYRLTTVNWANKCPLMMPADNLRINPYSYMEMKYAKVTYRLSIQELAGFMTDKSVYGGHMRIFSKDKAHNQLNVFGNHGAFVARANEPSLTRLATALTASASVSDMGGLRESRIQKLVDFVSQEIAYDDSEAKFKGEILKRPNETLLTRRGDCSSKSILLASLLEQLGEDYRLVYYNDHITVAVRKGHFENLNGLSFTRDGDTWMIAESTLAGFRIGETIVENAGIFSAMQYVQKPSSSESVSAFDDFKEIVFE